MRKLLILLLLPNILSAMQVQPRSLCKLAGKAYAPFVQKPEYLKAYKNDPKLAPHKLLPEDCQQHIADGILAEDTFWLFSTNCTSDLQLLVHVSSDKTTIRIVNIITGEYIKTIVCDCNDANINVRGTCIVSISNDPMIRIWDVETGKCIQILTGHTDKVKSANFSLDGTQIVSISDDHTIKIWDALTGKCLNTFASPSDNVLAVGFNPFGTKIASLLPGKNIVILDLRLSLDNKLKILSDDLTVRLYTSMIKEWENRNEIINTLNAGALRSYLSSNVQS